MLSAEQIQNLDVRLQNILPQQKIEESFSAKRGEVGQILFEEKIVKKPLAKILDKTDKKEVWKNKDLVCALLAKNFTRTNSGEDLQR